MSDFSASVIRGLWKVIIDRVHRVSIDKAITPMFLQLHCGPEQWFSALLHLKITWELWWCQCLGPAPNTLT